MRVSHSRSQSCALGLVPILVYALIASGASGGPQARRSLVDVPLVKQPYMLCLAASVSMVLAYWGHRVTPSELAGRVPVYKDGTIGRDYVKVVEELGLFGFLIQPPFQDLLQHLEKGRPLVVTVPESRSAKHAMVLVGFDEGTGQVWLNDPASGKRKVQPLDAFRREWEKGGRWTFLIIPKQAN